MKTLAFLVLGLFGAAAGAQPSPSGNPIATHLVFKAPSGNCNPGGPDLQVVATGAIWSCQGISPNTGVGTWGVIGPGSAGGAPGTNGEIIYNHSGLLAADTSVTDGSGNWTITSLNVQNLASIGPRYDVTMFGCVGDGTTDDTACIQAAFDACWNNGAVPNGGVVEFPGSKTYLHTATIKAHNHCYLEGVDPNHSGSVGTSELLFSGTNGSNTNSQGTTYTTSSVTVNLNNSGYLNAPYYPPFSPSPSAKYAYVATATVAATTGLTVGSWVQYTACTSTYGTQLNNGVGQIAEVGATTFTVPLSFATLNSAGTSSDTCTITVVNVGLAFDSNARNFQKISSLTMSIPGDLTSASANTVGINVYYGDRLDVGASVVNSAIDNATYYNLYVAGGGINSGLLQNVRMDGGGGIYWRIGGADSLDLGVGTMTNNTANFLMQQNSGFVVLDQSWGGVGSVQLGCQDIKDEPFATMPTGAALYTFLANPAISQPQFYANMQGCWDTAAGSQNVPIYQVVPQSDSALLFTTQGGQWVSTTPRWVGMNEFQRNDMTTGVDGVYGFSGFAPSVRSMAVNNGSIPNAIKFYGSIFQFIGDVNISQLWQHATQASAFLYTDTGLTVIPNGTTLYVGQIVAPPAYWNTTTSGKRYAIDVVAAEGTTGAPNSSGTTCATTATANQFSVSSGVDLSVGQHVSCGTATNKVIVGVNAANPAAVLLTVNGGVGSTSGTLSFVAPTFGLEMQLPTKSASAPSTLAWSQGDVEQMSGAAANGPCLLVNTAAGTPGTWDEVPCGNASGILTPAQAGIATGVGTYTTATSDAFTVTGATASSHCAFSATNALAAANTVVPYISSTTTNSVTITHVATTASGGTVSIVCTSN